MSFILGIDIGGTHVRLGLVDEANNLFEFTQLKTASIFNSNDPVDVLAEVISNYLEEYGKGKQISAISIGFPSTINKEAKVVVSTPNIPLLQNINVVNQLNDKLNLPIYINRDVNFLMLFDMYQQKIKIDGVSVGFYFGTGIGNAIFINGTPLKGKNGIAAELGHIPMINDSAPCTCGNFGCLENHASGRYLMSLIEQEFQGTDISAIFTLHVEHPKVKAFIENMAIAIALEISLLDPECIILGGGILQMKDFPKLLLEERIKDRTRKPLPSENLKLMYANEGQENGVIGASIYARQQLLERKDDEYDSSCK